MAMAATMMRRILINYAEAHKAAKRSGSVETIPLDDAFGVFTDPRVDLLHLNTTLERLTGLDPQQGRVVELRYFGGLSIDETAEVLGISAATVKREWSTARLWLMQQMQGGHMQ
jgi:RNA polymerase sigma factor (TIGR02999 family)